MEPLVLTVQIHRLPGNEDIPFPRYHTQSAAAMDLHAAVPHPVSIEPGVISLVPCGFALAVPLGFEGQIRPRSGLAIREGITVVNSPGTIDSDYRGEVKVALINLGTTPFSIERGMRIAQILIAPVPRVVWEEVPQLPATSRGEGGFGHTGICS